MGKAEEKHPFAVRLGWITLLITIAACILAVIFYHSQGETNDKVASNEAQLQQTNARLQTTNNGLLEGKWITCKKSQAARKISINNYKQEQKLYTYLRTVTNNSLTAAKLVVKSNDATPAEVTAAKQRIADNTQILAVVPNIIIPDPVPPCGPEPVPKPKHQ